MRITVALQGLGGLGQKKKNNLDLAFFLVVWVWGGCGVGGLEGGGVVGLGGGGGGWVVRVGVLVVVGGGEG